MYRRLVALFALALLAAVAPAAPVPTHLMPKDPPLNHPTAVGATWVYESAGAEETLVLTKADRKDEGVLVTIERVTGPGQTRPYQKVLVNEKGWFVTEEGGEAYDTPWCVLELPHRAGQRWTTDQTRGDGRLAFKGASRAAAAARVKVPAGAFVAAPVESRYTATRVSDAAPVADLSMGTTHWYAGGVGLVRVDEPVGRTRKTLKSFAPGKE